jgi:hypothetical protein
MAEAGMSMHRLDGGGLGVWTAQMMPVDMLSGTRKK